ncbi:ethanolamine utilization acetate kinase EutQ [Paraglaciecola arctica]|uniref:Ethanolamine utilization protein EutQ n=1 Tax=Paraglaciecola arctica BSs20135 TaxID=493475 RepID=K6ZFU0_9ALTE|nr:ethanolamine utilization acetate kinase EutQ [Paraglaciecola arctica]GAC22275.1 ethanolamine utilization protein EutQ [Paraglaciecola arctica BSs20135]
MKVLVTAQDIVKLHRNGETLLEILPRDTIITPEARDVANKLGVKISEEANLSEKTNISEGSRLAEGSHLAKGSSSTLQQSANTVHQIREAIEAKLPSGKHTPALLEQLVKKAIKELQHDVPDPQCERDVAESGVVLVRGNSVQFGEFDGAPGKSIGITDVIGTGDNSPIAAGFMQWEKSSFPWTLTYDEIDVVLEGELHIRCDGKTYIGKPGDVFYIPKDTAIEFATPSKVRFVYVTYPADWSGDQVPA